jgi:hypothetical protein
LEVNGIANFSFDPVDFNPVQKICFAFLTPSFSFTQHKLEQVGDSDVLTTALTT